MKERLIIESIFQEIERKTNYTTHISRKMIDIKIVYPLKSIKSIIQERERKTKYKKQISRNRIDI